ncbi:MAG: ribonuclease HII [Gammaproteobacteria bacterium]|nr:ribonuclease HII [Gammaproteobacteria bacterium]MBT8050130.1 ribonuclease HII [Gammaproteobacteria bacterium]MBT8057385.1 ribonuclease HII [Gammaproteobacteria bacterium]
MESRQRGNRADGNRLVKGPVAGVDEAGRGPLAGPVVAAAVILDPDRPIEGLDDSKKLNEARREALDEMIRSQALAYSVIEIPPAEIDRLNILAATLFGMEQAIDTLTPSPVLALVDGNRSPKARCTVRTIVGGDAIEPAISAASILAKVARDRCMVEWHLRYPDYGFDRHKGYPTAEHLRRLSELGPCEIHRRSFGPVRNALQGGLFNAGL